MGELTKSERELASLRVSVFEVPMTARPGKSDEASSGSVAIGILHRNAFDCDTLQMLLSSRQRYWVIGTSTSLEGFGPLCERTRADVAILDAGYPLTGGDVFCTAAMLKRQNKIRRILFFDDVPNPTRALRAVSIEGAGYVTRQRTALQFESALAELIEGRPPLDGYVSDWLQTEDRLEQRLQSTSPVLAPLTSRELDVLQLVAQGQSTESCAKLLQISASTVANYKTQIMRKLGVTKSNQLIHIAIREGVIAL